ncbi:MAG: LuxR C-terminal-related transcriptional regulator [Paracoccaceae bacterium]
MTSAHLNPATVSEHRFPARLRSKLEMPRTVADQILRPELADKIAGSDWAQLTVLHAPSGFGKTVVMTDAFHRARERGIGCAWMTVDMADNDAARFLFCLKQAVQGLDAHAAVAKTSEKTQTEEELAAALFDLIDSIRDPFALFLDDVEHLTETPSLELLSELSAALPEHGRIILASRTNPDLGQPRLRARGKLLELHHRDLRFEFKETECFLRRTVGKNLTVADIQQLHEKTEGWAVALRLAAGILGRTSDCNAVIRQLSHTDSVLSEFLVSEVLASQSQPVQDFLLTTSILRDLDPELCDQLFAPGGSAGILESLSQSNAPVSKIEGFDGLFRHHGMFASFLRNTLRKSRPDTVSGLHRIAMDWYVQQGRTVPAIEHAIQGGDFETALTLLSNAGRRLLEQGRVRLLSQWYQAIPVELMQQNPELLLQQGWANLFLQGPRAAQALIENSALGTETSDTVTVETLCLRTEIHSMLDDFHTAIEVGEEALPNLHLCSPFTRTVLLNALAYAYFVEGRFADARQTLQQARMEQSGDDDIFNVMFAESVQGLIDLRENRLREAMARFRVAANTTRSGARHKTNGNLMAGIPLACCNYERNDLAVAARQLRLHLPFVRDIGPIDHMILCHCILARISLCEGDLDQAFSLLVELEDLGNRRDLKRVVAGARLERVRIYLSQKQYGRARDELELIQARSADAPDNGRHLPANDVDTVTLHWIRLELLCGNAKRAAELVELELGRSRGQGRLRRSMLLDLLGAAAQYQLGETAASLTRTDRVLQQCAREGYIRFLIDEGPAVAAFLHAYSSNRLQGETALRDPLFVDWLQELVSLLPPQKEPHAAGVNATALPLDPLTPKEMEILRLLDKGYSNAAISEQLCVSNSTVRTHLRNINSKLATSSRGQAVAAARGLHIL